jgi:uncharacterized protein (TIGR02145 family)
MKKLLLMMMCCPALLAAQSNGVKVSNLAVDAGTVTFDVSWKNTGMPLVWCDTVWVWVDYNNNGVMERLPVTGATASAGTVTKVPNNDKGVWVAGNARTKGSFSATVKLLTATADVAGACAYASNYPPVGKYNDDGTGISFTGTPMYEILLAKADGGSVTVVSGDTLLLPCDYIVTSFIDATGAPGIMKNYCTAPGHTVNFTAFNPCEGAAIGTVWYLTDTREAASTLTEARARTYKVKKMQDGRIWMVQDMKFGDKCGKLTFSGSNGRNQTGNLSSVFTGYYGDCTAATNINTPPTRGYLYDWAAVVNASGAYYSGTYTGCSGTSTAANACQGICPVGWHVPTGNTDGEFYDLHTNYGRGCVTNNDNCWDAGSDWEGLLGGGCWSDGGLNVQGIDGGYWSSTFYTNTNAYELVYRQSATYPGTYNVNYKSFGIGVRCVRNY